MKKINKIILFALFICLLAITANATIDLIVIEPSSETKTVLSEKIFILNVDSLNIKSDSTKEDTVWIEFYYTGTKGHTLFDKTAIKVLYEKIDYSHAPDLYKLYGIYKVDESKKFVSKIALASKLGIIESIDLNASAKVNYIKASYSEIKQSEKITACNQENTEKKFFEISAKTNENDSIENCQNQICNLVNLSQGIINQEVSEPNALIVGLGKKKGETINADLIKSIALNPEGHGINQLEEKNQEYKKVLDSDYKITIKDLDHGKSSSIGKYLIVLAENKVENELIIITKQVEDLEKNFVWNISLNEIAQTNKALLETPEIFKENPQVCYKTENKSVKECNEKTKKCAKKTVQVSSINLKEISASCLVASANEKGISLNEIANQVNKKKATKAKAVVDSRSKSNLKKLLNTGKAVAKKTVYFVNPFAKPVYAAEFKRGDIRQLIVKDKTVAEMTVAEIYDGQNWIEFNPKPQEALLHNKIVVMYDYGSKMIAEYLETSTKIASGIFYLAKKKELKMLDKELSENTIDFIIKNKKMPFTYDLFPLNYGELFGKIRITTFGADEYDILEYPPLEGKAIIDVPQTVNLDYVNSARVKIFIKLDEKAFDRVAKKKGHSPKDFAETVKLDFTFYLTDKDLKKTKINKFIKGAGTKEIDLFYDNPYIEESFEMNLKSKDFNPGQYKIGVEIEPTAEYNGFVPFKEYAYGRDTIYGIAVQILLS